MEIRALHESDDRSRFQSGDLDLDRFLIQYAGQNQFRHHIGVTYVAVDGARIHGYVTVAPGQMETTGLPASNRRMLPQYPLPVLRLARLAVDQSSRGQGLGSQLLRFVLRMARRMADDYGCTGVVVDARPDAIDFCSRFGFIVLDPIEGQSDARPQPAVMFLLLSAILKAQNPRRKKRK